jgi:hypothetical protein
LDELALPYFAREIAPLDAETRLAEFRLEVFMRRCEEAARECGLEVDERDSVKNYANAIVETAKRASLDPRHYEVAWFVRKTA